MTIPVVPPARIADAGADTGAPPAPPPADPTAAAMRALALRRAQFDVAAEERAEFQREADVLRDMMMAQLKSEDQYLHKWIEMI